MLSLIRLDSLRGGKTHVFGDDFAVRDWVAENVSFPRLRSPRGFAFTHPARLAARGKTHVFGYEVGVRDCVAENVSFPRLRSRGVLLSLIRLDSLRGGKTHLFGYEAGVSRQVLRTEACAQIKRSGE